MLVDQLGDQSGPTSLVARAQAGAGVAVKIFVEENQVLPMGIAVELLETPVRRALAVVVPKEDTDEPFRQVVGHLPQSLRVAGTGRFGHLELVTQKIVVLLQRLDQQKVEREPDRAAPVGVAAEHAAGRFGRLVVEGESLTFDVQYAGVLRMGP